MNKFELETDETTGYSGLIKFEGDKYKIYIDQKKKIVRGVYLTLEGDEENAQWDKDTAIVNAKQYLSIFAGENIKYTLEENITESYGMWDYSAKEMKDGVFTGSWYEIIFTQSGNICAANLVIGNNQDAQKISEEAATLIAIENIERYGKNDAGKIMETVQTSIAGDVVWKVYSEKVYGNN